MLDVLTGTWICFTCGSSSAWLTVQVIFHTISATTASLVKPSPQTIRAVVESFNLSSIKLPFFLFPKLLLFSARNNKRPLPAMVHKWTCPPLDWIFQNLFETGQNPNPNPHPNQPPSKCAPCSHIGTCSLHRGGPAEWLEPKTETLVRVMGGGHFASVLCPV